MGNIECLGAMPNQEAILAVVELGNSQGRTAVKFVCRLLLLPL
jgi:hypothetical protein